MAKQVARSGLASKLGAEARKRWEENKANGPEYGVGGILPAGIENGIAQLSKCGFGIYKKGAFTGQFFYMAMGVVQLPTSIIDAKGVSINIKGLQTRVGPIPICDTPHSKGQHKTQADHFDFVRNELAKLKGGSMDEFSPDTIEDAAKLLEEAKPYFRFRTWQGPATEDFPNPRVNEEWRGVCEYNPDAEDTGVTDETGGSADAGSADNESAKAKGEGGGSLRDLIEAADREDDNDEESVAARQAITEAAAAAGMDVDGDDFAALSWSEVVDQVEGSENEGEEKEQEDEEIVPAKDDECKANLKGFKKPIAVKIISVDKKSKTVTIKRQDNKATVKDIAWSSLVW